MRPESPTGAAPAQILLDPEPAPVSGDRDMDLAVRIARWTDNRFLDPIIGLLVPGLGDLLTAGAGLFIVKVAAARRLPRPVISERSPDAEYGEARRDVQRACARVETIADTDRVRSLAAGEKELRTALLALARCAIALFLARASCAPSVGRLPPRACGLCPRSAAPRRHPDRDALWQGALSRPVGRRADGRRGPRDLRSRARTGGWLQPRHGGRRVLSVRTDGVRLCALDLS
jgi:hypothetical protein